MLLLLRTTTRRHQTIVTFVALAAAAVTSLPAIEAAAVGQRCGVHVCELLEFCSPVHTQCEPCRMICEPANANHYDKILCQSNCGNYLYEQHIINASKKMLQNDINGLQRQQTLMWIFLLVLCALFLLLNGARGIHWLRRHDHLSFKWLKRLRSRRDQKPGQTITVDQMTHANPHTNSPKVTSRGNMAGPQVTVDHGASRIQRQASTVYSINDHASTVQTVSTPISRHPAEDITGSFSYDNAGLQVTPTTSKPKSESTF